MAPSFLFDALDASLDAVAVADGTDSANPQFCIYTYIRCETG